MQTKAYPQQQQHSFAHININLTLSNIKRGTDLGTLVVPFNQTFHPLHTLNAEKYILLELVSMNPDRGI